MLETFVLPGVPFVGELPRGCWACLPSNPCFWQVRGTRGFRVRYPGRLETILHCVSPSPIVCFKGNGSPFFFHLLRTSETCSKYIVFRGRHPNGSLYPVSTCTHMLTAHTGTQRKKGERRRERIDNLRGIAAPSSTERVLSCLTRQQSYKMELLWTHFTRRLILRPTAQPGGLLLIVITENKIDKYSQIT